MTLPLASLRAQKVESPLSLFPVRQQWTLALNQVLIAPPVLSSEHAFFPLETEQIVAYELVTGRQLWISPAKPLSAPAHGDGLLYIAESTRLAAFDAATGLLRWQLPFTEPLAVPLVWDNGWLIAAAESGTLLAFRANDGTLIWRQELGAAASRPVALAADRVYVPIHDGRVIALRVENGERVWERKVGGAPSDLLALEDRVYLGATDNYFYGLRAETGAVDFRFRTGADVLGRPLADERRVYFVSLDNVLRGLDRRTGVQHWKRALPLRPTVGAVRIGDVLLVSGLSPKVQVYAIKDGAHVGELVAGGLLATPPHAIDGAFLPRIVMVAKDLTQGTLVTALVRAIDPPPTPINPLPNPISPDGPTPPPTTAPTAP